MLDICCRGYTWNEIISQLFQPSSTSVWNNVAWHYLKTGLFLGIRPTVLHTPQWESKPPLDGIDLRCGGETACTVATYLCDVCRRLRQGRRLKLNFVNNCHARLRLTVTISSPCSVLSAWNSRPSLRGSWLTAWRRRSRRWRQTLMHCSTEWMQLNLLSTVSWSLFTYSLLTSDQTDIVAPSSVSVTVDSTEVMFSALVSVCLVVCLLARLQKQFLCDFHEGLWSTDTVKPLSILELILLKIADWLPFWISVTLCMNYMYMQFRGATWQLMMETSTFVFWLLAWVEI